VRRGSIVQLVIIGVIAGAISTAVAIFVPWMPESASEEFDRINFTYWFATVISLFVFAVVAAVLVYCLINFRVEEGDFSDGPPVHGHTMLEIVWTVIPTILVTAICVVSAIVLAQNSRAGENPLVVQVVAQQFAWQFKYAEDGKTYGSLRLPIDRKIKLEITANDVIHSFWVPEFAQKQDAVPGQTYPLVITPTREGTFPVICTELCGLGHSLMRSEAIVMKEADFNAWLESENKPPEGGGDALATFEQYGCGACHVFEPAGTTGAVGPPLENLGAAAEAAGLPLEEFIRESIVDPNARAAEGYAAGTMPPFAQIPDEQLDGLVQYLAENAA
jgi:cytochrome c oxidase subunit 2